MLVPYYDGSSPPKEDIMNSITDHERKRMKEIEYGRGSIFDRFCRVSTLKEPSIVLDDFLFLGNMLNATNREVLQQFQIQHILNVCDWDTNQIIRENFNVIHIPLSDDTQTNIKQHFDRTNELLHGFYEKNERCLVHCAAGVSRSATIVLAYLMKYHHNTLKEAYSYLIEKRPQICPNEGFLLQLLRYENDLIRSRELQPVNKRESIVKEDNPIETLTEFKEKHMENV